ncbi:hypothetical protein F441_13577 [Phytophthora nicotianae CJ01A1]|uniref:Uncharacterized protein n=3 Tax=Phytophthora nicotianae TaxID=4792 RepID=W2R7F5_PHYN3|nr:hypothetical protein PPTG_21341 [Phytophthora nicotianae INRA-310]ETL34601.1 hypothetical protein L916_13199 [Phytophthora nicotianae]ETN20639.1 hypothetical protein PPTG_21341 [Phytophthora nicotianae INRA-310]ETP10869.1 hypothetical protein F441_13577 [Phytophthora nicotianae CJ01A1]
MKSARKQNPGVPSQDIEQQLKRLAFDEAEVFDPKLLENDSYFSDKEQSDLLPQKSRD